MYKNAWDIPVKQFTSPVSAIKTEVAFMCDNHFTTLTTGKIVNGK